MNNKSEAVTSASEATSAEVTTTEITTTAPVTTIEPQTAITKQTTASKVARTLEELVSASASIGDCENRELIHNFTIADTITTKTFTAKRTASNIS